MLDHIGRWRAGPGLRNALFAGLMALLLAACGGGGDTPAVGSTTVGADGGTLQGDDGVQLSVPPGAMTEALTLRVARDTTGMNAALLGVAPDPLRSVDLSPTYALTPHGTHFDTPAQLRIPLGTAARGPGTLVVLRTEPGRDSWDMLPVTRVENGAAVVAIDGFSYYKAVRVVQMPSMPAAGPQAPVMSATLGGVGPEDYTVPGINPSPGHRRLYGEITSRSQTLRYAGRLEGVPAACANITLNGAYRYPKAARAEDAVAGQYGPGYDAEIARTTATAGSAVVNGQTRATLDFGFDLNIDNAPFKTNVFQDMRAGSNTGPTPTVAVSFNAWANCSSPLDLGGGNVVDRLKVMPGVERAAIYPTDPDWVSLDDKGWTWVTVKYGVDYLPQGFVTHPSDVSAPVGSTASFSTSAWPTPVGEQRIEWWRSNNDGNTWTRVRTSIVPTADTADTYTLDNVASTDNNALFRARLCTTPRVAGVVEGCTDGIAARLTVLQGVVAASFSLQPRALLVRSGETASLSVVAQGAPTPTLRWQSRPANSNGAWSDLTTGVGPTSANYTTAPLQLSDNGVQLRAVASNLAGDVPSSPVTISVSDVDIAPTITTQPASLAVAAGGDAVFAIAAHGTEAMSYQWRFNGANMAGANGPILKLAAVSAAHAGSYSVVVVNAAGSATSQSATLNVTSGAAASVAPTIVTQPVAVTVHEGDTATFAVGVGGTAPYNYQWLKDGQPIAGATAAYFSLAATPASAGTYTVQVGNTVGSVTSDGAALMVSAATAPTQVSISTQPAAQVQMPGGTATFAVAASGTGPLSYQWLKGGTSIVGATQAVLVLSGVSVADEGSYSVTVGNALGSVTSNAASLTVVGAPAISTQPSAVSVTEGSTATFSVVASGNSLRYQWLRDGAIIAGATASSYTTGNLSLSDNGAAFSVVVYNAAGVVFSQSATLTVTAAPPAGLTAKAVAAGYGSSFAVDLDGSVWAWGYLVDPSTGGYKASSPWATQPVKVQGLSGVKSITAVSESGAFYALHDDGTVSAWGRNDVGQLGDGTTTTRSLPVAVMKDASNRMTGICKIAGGPNAMAMAPCNAGPVWIVGLLAITNFGGDTGSGLRPNGAVAKTVPGLPNTMVVRTLSMPDAAANALGSLIIVYDNETVYAWGQQRSNSLGAGAAETLVGTALGPVDVLAGVGSLAGVELGRDFSIFLGVDYRLKAVGRNLEGQLGVGNNSTLTTPTSVAVLDIVSRFSVGQFDVAAIQNGELWIWGWNNGNVLTQPTRLGSGASYTEVAMGDIHGLVIGAGGAVYSWGDGSYGALGNGYSSSSLPVMVPRP